MAKWPSIGTRYIQQTFTPGEGIDTFKSPVLLAPGQASDMQDFSSRQFPSLRTREGRQAISSSINQVEANILKLHVTPDGILHCLYTYLNGATRTLVWAYQAQASAIWTTIESYTAGTKSYASEAFAFADWYDQGTSKWWVYCSRHDGAAGYTVTYWNQTAVARIAYATTALVSGPMCSHLNRMFATAQSASGNLLYSALADPGTWTTGGGSILVGKNDAIQSLISMTDRLFIGTKTGVYVLFGDASTNFTLQCVSSSISVQNGSASASMNNVVYFTDGYAIYEYSASNGIVEITRSLNTNNVSGGFAESNRLNISGSGYSGSSMFSSSPTDAEFSTLGVSADRLYCATTTLGSATKYDWYVFDIKRRRWYIELGFYNYGTPAFAITPYGKAVSSCQYYTGGAMVLYPRVYELTGGTTGDNYAQLMDYGAITATGGTYSSGVTTGDGSLATIGMRRTTSRTCVTGHKIYVSFKFRVQDAACQTLNFYLESSTGITTTVLTTNNPTINTYYSTSTIVTLGGTHTGVVRLYATAVYADAATANGKKLEVFATQVGLLCDDLSCSYAVGSEPSVAQYEAEWPTTWTASLNPTSVQLAHTIAYDWISPAYQIRPSAKKTLANIWVTADIETSDFTIQTENTITGTSWKTVYTATGTLGNAVVKAKIPVAYNQKSEYIRVRIAGTGQVSISGLVFDWRITERTK